MGIFQQLNNPDLKPSGGGVYFPFGSFECEVIANKHDPDRPNRRGDKPWIIEVVCLEVVSQQPRTEADARRAGDRVGIYIKNQGKAAELFLVNVKQALTAQVGLDCHSAKDTARIAAINWEEIAELARLENVLKGFRFHLDVLPYKQVSRNEYHPSANPTAEQIALLADLPGAK